MERIPRMKHINPEHYKDSLRSRLFDRLVVNSIFGSRPDLLYPNDFKKYSDMALLGKELKSLYSKLKKFVEVRDGLDANQAYYFLLIGTLYYMIERKHKWNDIKLNDKVFDEIVDGMMKTDIEMSDKNIKDGVYSYNRADGTPPIWKEPLQTYFRSKGPPLPSNLRNDEAWF